MARKCDNCNSVDGVQKVVLQVVSGESCQCHGDFCRECREGIPDKLESAGFTVNRPKKKPAAPVSEQVK